MTIVGLASAFWVSYVLLWCVVGLFGLLIVLLFRQFGLAFMGRADRVAMQGLDVGGSAPGFALTDKQGQDWHVAFGPEAGVDGPTAVIFTLPTCEICAGLAATLASLPAERPSSRFVWVDGSSPHPPQRAIDEAPGWISGSAPGDAIHRQWDVSAVPFCFVVAPTGRISEKRLVNRREDVELALGITPRPAPALTPSPIRS